MGDKLKNAIAELKNNIAFYPILISITGFALAVIMLCLESFGISEKLAAFIPRIVIDNASTSRTLMSFLTAGIISIMVFSFSLVMILLNQASNSFSPRVLPGLISNRKHQYIIGFYLSVIVYNTFVTIGIDPTKGEKYTIPGIAILLGISLTMLCFIAFIYFIHSISQSIQVNHILERLSIKGKRMLEELIPSEQTYQDFDDAEHWESFESEQTGYYQKVNGEALIKICREFGIRIKVLPIPGFFVIQNTPLFSVNKKIDKDTEQRIRNNILFSTNELAEQNYIFAFKQIAEIGIKAMSPGINDPGTALNTIDYLTDLFLIRLKKSDRFFIADEDKAVIELATVDFSDLIYQIMAPYRTYCKHDMTCIQRLFIMLRSIAKKADNKTYRQAVLSEMENLFEDVSESVTNKRDLALAHQLCKNSLP